MNLHRLFSFILIAFSLLSGASLAANSRSLSQSPQVLQRINHSATLHEAFNLSPQETLIKSKSRVDKRGLSHTRYRQAYHGVPIWGEEIIINRDQSGKAIYVNGCLIQNLADLPFDTMALIMLMV